MSVLTSEGRVVLAIEAIRTTSKMSVRQAAKIYQVPEATLRHRISGRTSKAEQRNARHNLSEFEEETLVRYILDLDLRGFPPRIEDVGDMANLLLASRGTRCVGKQ